MKRLLLPLLAALALPTACSNGEFSNKPVNEDLKICPAYYTKKLIGTDYRMVDKNQILLTTTNSIAIKNALNNEYLQEHIALLKLETVEEFQKFTGETITEETSKDGRTIISSSYNNSWDQMKRSIASMKEKYICIKKGSNKDEIFFTGEWSTKSIKIVNRIIEYREAHDD